MTLEEESFDLVLIQEPWLGAGGRVKGLASGKYILFLAQCEGKKRSAILAKRNLMLTFILVTAQMTKSW